MEVKKVLWLLFATSFCCGSEIPDFIGKLIGDLKGKKPMQVHDVVLIRLLAGNKELTEKITKAISQENVVLMPPTGGIVTNQRIRAASVVVIVSDIVDENSLKHQLIFMQRSSYFVNTGKIVFVTNRILAPGKVVNLFKFLQSIGLLNILIILDEPEPKLCLYHNFKNKGKLTKLRQSTANITVLFPDKLKNMHRYQYKLLVMPQHPRITLKNNYTEFTGIDVEIMKTIAASQNAEIQILFKLNPTGSEKVKIFRYVTSNQLADITLNTYFKMEFATYREFINTYDQNGYCAIIPIPPPMTFLRFLFTPFDGLSWTFMIGSVIACALVWHILNRVRGSTDSALYFIFGMVANFVGQGIPFRRSHKWQTILMQCCVLMMFIMGNAYQSLIVSSMTWSRDGLRIKTFQELFDSGAKMYVTETFYTILKNSNEFNDAVSRMETVKTIQTKSLIRAKEVVIARCDYLEYMMKVDIELDIGSHFYLLPDSMMPSYEKLSLARGSPFYEKLQMMHDYVFESGIRQHWKYLLKQEESAEMKRNDLYIKSEDYLLRMADLNGVFYLLLGGYAVSAFVFVLELIWSYLKNDVDYWKIAKWFKKICRTKKQAMQLRRMQVHPIDN